MRDVLDLLANDSSCDLTGNRLWLDKIEQTPGLVAEIGSYITYNNLPLSKLIEYHFVQNGAEAVPCLQKYRWSPAGIEAEYQVGTLKIQEMKHITQEDIFISFLELENEGNRPCEWDVYASTLLSAAKASARALYNPDYIEYENSGGHFVRMEITLNLTARNVLRGVCTPAIVLGGKNFNVSADNDSFSASIHLEPHQKTAVFVCGIMSHTQPLQNLQEVLKTFMETENIQSVCKERCREWFDQQVPLLSCSDKVLEKLYYYHYYVLKKNLIRPEFGCFQHWCLYEGKDQFALVCSGSAAMHIRELRWLKTPHFVMDELRTLASSQVKKGKAAGRLLDLYVSDLPSAVWETLLFLPCSMQEIIKKHRDSVKAYVDWERSQEYVPEGKTLPVVVGSWRTAGEYQPSFFEFTYPAWDHEQSNPFGKERNTALHRVDDSTNLSTNLQAVAKLYRLSGDMQTANVYACIAEEVGNQIVQCMWDEKTKFFYDVCPTTGEKARQSKNFAGFLGARTKITQSDKEAVMDHLKREFATPYPIPTVATDCPAFSPDNTWKIGPHADEQHPYFYPCCWNGPSWNFSNSLVIDILGETVQSSDIRYNEDLFEEIFRKWCKEQCRSESAVPNVCEHYNPFTGEALRDVKDYSHSTFIDIVFRRIVGISVSETGKIQFKPLNIGLDELSVYDIPVQGHSVDFIWNTSQQNKLEVYLDGNLVFQHSALVDFEI